VIIEKKGLIVCPKPYKVIMTLEKEKEKEEEEVGKIYRLTKLTMCIYCMQ
jgi:hypothetical protein